MGPAGSLVAYNNVDPVFVLFDLGTEHELPVALQRARRALHSELLTAKSRNEVLGNCLVELGAKCGAHLFVIMYPACDAKFC